MSNTTSSETRTKKRWTSEEDELIRDESLNVMQLARKLPTRTRGSIESRRYKLGVKTGIHSSNFNPHYIGGRRILAKTCSMCGLLLSESNFRWYKKRQGWSPYCRKCGNARSVQYQRAAKGRSDSTQPEQSKRDSSGISYTVKAQELTLPQATRWYYEYTELDHEVLRDPNLSLLQKALTLKRTYNSVASASYRNGYTSLQADDSEGETWIIDNPNAERLEEIAAELSAA